MRVSTNTATADAVSSYGRDMAFCRSGASLLFMIQSEVSR